MPTVDQATQQGPLLEPGLLAGLVQLSAEGTVTLTAYSQQILPLDGYVFWLNSQSQIRVKGSLHYAASTRQVEETTAAINRIVLTTTEEIQQFNNIAPTRIWIGEIDGVRFAFSQRKNRYQSAGLFHYVGDAVYPYMASQLIDSLDQIDPAKPVVSNSLPAWLGLPNYKPIWLAPTNPGVALYPSFLVPKNTIPPYGAVHIEPSQTRALQALASFDTTTTHSQLAADRVRITLFGLTNDDALDFLDLIIQYCKDDTGALGLMSTPIVRDEKQAQPEIGVIAMRKAIDVEVSYYQTRINDIAREQIKAATLQFIPPAATLWDNGGVLMFVATTYYPISPRGLADGALWSNGLVVMVAGTTEPNPDAPPLYFGLITAANLQRIGGGNLPLTLPKAGSGQLWNNNGVVSVA